MEIKRVLCSKKTVFIMAIFLIVTVWFFIKEQTGDSQYFNQLNEFRNEEMAKCQNLEPDKTVEYLKQQASYYDAMSDLAAMPTLIETKQYQQYAQQYEAVKDELNPEDIDRKKAIISEILTAAEHVSTYEESIANIKEKAVKMVQISIFAKKDSFAYKEIQKAVKDYKPLEGILVNMGNDKVITSVVDFQLIHYILFAFAIVIISQFLEERKLGLWSMVHSEKKGRFVLALKRVAILFGGVVAITVLFYGVIFAISCKMYGVPSFSRMIQSIPEFGDFVIPLNIGGFIVVFILTKIFALFLTALIIWFIMSVIQSRNVALLVLALMFATEYGCFQFIAPQSNLNIFKYANIFYYINPSDMFTYYRNLRFIKLLIGRLELMYVGMIVLTIVFIVICIATNGRKRPVKTPGKIEKMLDRCIVTIQRPFELLPAWMVEFHKSFIWQKGILIIAVFVYMAFSGIKDIGYTYKQSDSYLKSFYSSYSGVVTQETIDYVNAIQADCDNAQSSYKEAQDQYSKGLISNSQLDKIKNINDTYASKRTQVLAMNKNITYVQNLNSKGYDAHIIDDTSYRELFGKTNYSVDNLISIKIIFLLVLLLSGIFAFEKKSNTVNFLRSLKKGRKSIFRMKMVVTIVVTVGLWALYYGIQLYQFYNNYGFTYLSAPLKSIKIMENVPLNCSIGAFLIILYMTRFVMLICVAWIVMMISSIVSMEISLIASFAVCLMPSVMIYVGIDLFKNLSVAMPINFIENFINAKGYAFLIPIILMLIFGIASFVVSYKKWCSYAEIKVAGKKFFMKREK